jgi:hypothetical protein
MTADSTRPSAPQRVLPAKIVAPASVVNRNDHPWAWGVEPSLLHCLVPIAVVASHSLIAHHLTCLISPCLDARFPVIPHLPQHVLRDDVLPSLACRDLRCRALHCRAIPFPLTPNLLYELAMTCLPDIYRNTPRLAARRRAGHASAQTGLALPILPNPKHDLPRPIAPNLRYSCRA